MHCLILVILDSLVSLLFQKQLYEQDLREMAAIASKRKKLQALLSKNRDTRTSLEVAMHLAYSGLATSYATIVRFT